MSGSALNSYSVFLQYCLVINHVDRGVSANGVTACELHLEAISGSKLHGGGDAGYHVHLQATAFGAQSGLVSPGKPPPPRGGGPGQHCI